MADGSPMSPGMVALMTILLIVGAFLVIGWIIKTLTFALSTIVVIAVLGAGLYLYARYKAG